MGEKGKNLTEKEELMMLFTLHDTNKDGMLDGIELRAAFSDFNDQHTPNSQSSVSLKHMLDMIDHVIGEDDLNNEYVPYLNVVNANVGVGR
jgi:Ca2+-binding EF-hand superfamily protein